MPQVHNIPLVSRGLAEFWGRRWNLWFSDWFRYAVFDRLRSRPGAALILAGVAVAEAGESLAPGIFSTD